MYAEEEGIGRGRKSSMHFHCMLNPLDSNGKELLRRSMKLHEKKLKAEEAVNFCHFAEEID